MSRRRSELDVDPSQFPSEPILDVDPSQFPSEPILDVDPSQFPSEPILDGVTQGTSAVTGTQAAAV
jgi:hypothetical protein